VQRATSLGRWERKDDNKIGTIRKVEGAAARGVEGLGAAMLGAILLILSDLLVFLFPPLLLCRRAPAGR
jgi:hypothetical protein